MGKLTHTLGALVVAIALVASAPAGAQQAQSSSTGTQAQRQETQPLNTAPVWREVRSGSPGYTTVQGVETGVLVQSGGETWRQVRVPIAFWGGVVVAAAVLGLAFFYLFQGLIGVHKQQPGGRLIRRFSPADRHAHWLMAISWSILAITGLILSLGKTVLLPVVGYTVFAWLASMSMTLHNFTGPILIVAVPWLFIRFVRDNGFGSEDVKWLLNLPKFLMGKEYPSHRFNAGEKLIPFWLLLPTLCIVLIVTGLVMIFPNFGQGRETMQVVNTIHMVSSYMAIAIGLIHIYYGTIGSPGSYAGMRYGYVDENWAKEHHLRWYEDIVAGKARETFAEPGEGPPEKAAPPGKPRTA
jgi:formate dehydrogenase subunit gamma